MTFLKNLSDGSPVFPRGRTDMTELIVALRNIADVPKSTCTKYTIYKNLFPGIWEFIYFSTLNSFARWECDNGDIWNRNYVLGKTIKFPKNIRLSAVIAVTGEQAQCKYFYEEACGSWYRKVVAEHCLLCVKSQSLDSLNEPLQFWAIFITILVVG